MFGKITAFELRYQLRNPVFWVVAILFFLLTFGAMTVDEISIGSGGNVNVNSPASIIQIQAIMTVFFMFVTTAFVANVIVRDDESGFGPMVRSTRVSKRDYLFGRFTGAFLAAALAFAAVPFAIWLGSLMPWLDPETLGPNRLRDYAYGYFVFAVPGIFLTSCLFFAVATMTRSMMYSYVGVVIFMVAYFIFTGVISARPELRDIGSYFEPFGLSAYSNTTRYWTAAESNTLVPGLSGALLVNRLIWIAAGIAALLVAYRAFSFAERGVSARKLRKQEKLSQKLAAQDPLLVETLPAANPSKAGWARFLARTRFEMAQVFKSPAFFVLLLIGLFNACASLYFGREIYGTPARPLTSSIIPILFGAFGIIPIIIAIYYGGELVWRDRDRKIHEIIDSTSLPGWAYVVPKTIALVGVLFATLLVSVIGAVLIQLVMGHTDLAPGQYFMWYLLPFTVDMVILAILAIFVQALSPNKYIGWGIMVIYLVASITLSSIGFDHPLYQYGDTPFPQLSDLNGNNVNGAAGWWLRLYWGAVALMLAVLAHFLWRRGTQVNLMPRLRALPRQISGRAGMVLAAGAVVAVASGAYIFNNMNIINEYRTADDGEKLLADYEKKYLKYESLKQPSTRAVKLKVDIFPAQQRMEVAGTLTLVNDTGAAVPDLHVRFRDENVQIEDVAVEGAELSMDDAELKYRIYRFTEPMQAGETRTVRFRSSRHQRGFRANGNDTRLVQNGTFLNNSEFAPIIGMSRAGLLSDRQTRREYDLPAELRPPKLEDASARDKNYVGDVDWVMSDITVSTAKAQTPIAPGNKVSDEIRGDRRIARFIASSPILNFFSVQSAQYAVEKRKVGDVDMAVYYHPSHEWNVARMLDASEASLKYYEANFGPYQFDHFRIVEFPGYAAFAQAFAGTIPFSENMGFAANNADAESIDYVSYVTAHEFAHQYWAHQLISADQQGGTVLVETMAQYSALMVMKELYGEDKIRRFLKYELDRYLSARGSEAIEELPLNRVEDQGYIHYRKGAVVMYLLQDRLGEARVNAMLAGLLNRYRFKSQPYASSTDLVDGFKSLARNDAERQLVTDLLEKITVYDLKAEDAVTRKLANGQYETKLTVKAVKYYADGEGKEKAAPLSDAIDIGLFTAKPGLGAFDKTDVISMKRSQIKSGKQVIKVVTSKKPAFAGVDPYNKYIDRNGDDNLVAVTAS